jgi:Tannase-like family of unknown function (DUF6351)
MPISLRRIAVLFAVTAGFAVSASPDHPHEPKFRLLQPHHQEGSRDFTITTLSARNDVVSGGDVLVRVDVNQSIALGNVRVELNGSDVTSSFRGDGHGLMGLVTGLVNGVNVLEASEKAKKGKGPSARLKVTNWPITGPIFSGPHETPFFCTTTTFILPTTLGNLGQALDADCSATTRVDYVYRSSLGTQAFKPLSVNGVLPTTLPTDIALLPNSTVRYIVRVETGTVNRGIYQIAINHDPYLEPPPDPFHRPAGWNGKLIYQHGAGCQAGWYTQGTTTGGVLDVNLLGRGYARASNSLNVFNQNCNDLLSSETTSMTKERFIEHYGVPKFTLGTGSSGGSYQSHQTSENYPGLFDGILVQLAFPDVVTATAYTVGDARLLFNYFNNTAPGFFTQEQQRLVSGFGQFGSIRTLSDSGTSARRLDPRADFKDEVPLSARYNPVTNPHGARGDVYDHTINVYGRNPDTGFARRPLDNVGVQYGLKVLNAGQITKDQFLDLNEHIGGFDIDLNPIPQRHSADRHAVRTGRESGRVLQGMFGLAETPIVDVRQYNDAIVNGDIHQIVNNFTTRERLVRSNGHHDNHIILIGGRNGFTPDSPDLGNAWDALDRWVSAIQADNSPVPRTAKVVKDKPADLVDACWSPGSAATGGHVYFPGNQEYQGTGPCYTLYPRFATPRMQAGSPLVQDVMICPLKRIDPADYAVTFTPAEMTRLNAIFPNGVCDWTKRPPDYSMTRGTWVSFGPAGLRDADDDD